MHNITRSTSHRLCTRACARLQTARPGEARLAARAPWHHARSRRPDCFLRAIWKYLLVHSFVLSVLFIYSCVAFFELWEGIIKQKKKVLKFRRLRLSALDHQGAVPLAHW